MEMGEIAPYPVNYLKEMEFTHLDFFPSPAVEGLTVFSMNGQGKEDQLNRGTVVDALFPERLPAIYNLLRTGEGGKTKIEVNTHLDARRVRGIALTPTQGLALGTMIEDSGAPIQVPVGERLLGRVFNVLQLERKRNIITKTKKCLKRTLS
jgi:F0F1-type ATP synthase beta subunit